MSQKAIKLNSKRRFIPNISFLTVSIKRGINKAANVLKYIKTLKANPFKSCFNSNFTNGTIKARWVFQLMYWYLWIISGLFLVDILVKTSVTSLSVERYPIIASNWISTALVVGIVFYIALIIYNHKSKILKNQPKNQEVSR